MAAWRVAYAGMMPGEYLEGLKVERREAVWQGACGQEGAPVWVGAVEDFEASLKWLKDQGGEPYFGPYESPVCHMVLINDTDGNSICIHKRKPGHG